MTRRRGVTLTEVLVAIFVTGLGLMALMTLFPLGALNMAQALKDDRAAQASVNATGYFRAWWREQLQRGLSDPSIEDAMLKSGGADLTGQTGPSYPVYIDPRGVYGYVGAASSQLAGSSIPRITAPWVESLPVAQKGQARVKRFTLLDDMTFDQNAQPRVSGEVEREGRYSWAYMARRLRANEPRVLDYAVVVYNGRSFALNGSQPLDETAYDAVLPVGGTVFTFNYGGNKPKLRAGGWVLDATMTSTDPHGFFYRVVNVTDSGGSMTVELQTPIRGTANGNKVAILNNVAEVFERSTAE